MGQFDKKEECKTFCIAISFFFWFTFWNSILKKVLFGLKYFHDFFSSLKKKLRLFFTISNNYKIFEIQILLMESLFKYGRF